MFYSVNVTKVALAPTILRLLLAKPWINEINPLLIEIINDDTVAQSWKWILIKGKMLGVPDDYQSIWQQVVQSDGNSYDDGDSKTNTLYVIAAYAKNAD